MKQIQSSGAPGAIGPYSQGFMTNGLIFTSGQLPADPATGEIPEGITAQTEQSCKNVLAILDAAGSGAEKVVKTTCFLAEIADFGAFNEVYAKYFVSKPARSCFAVKALPKGALCEIECVAKA
ncbi:Rid family detoxifying hydrolase [Pseudoramibacter faecis]|uniref:Rid family detoxifying hydrolase n=1 Tax=Pseudoramibacter faecis TaxID=3108534 RepID=UPI002E797961|nr:Rid family detoxifying hydrolase [Pseudoramibacter sp. HA2172]